MKLADMTEEELRFSYGVLLSAVAYKQLGRGMDGNTRTAMMAVQQDIETVKKDLATRLLDPA